MENDLSSFPGNEAQKKYLYQYLLEFPGDAAGDYLLSKDFEENNREWAVLKTALDDLGPKLSLEQWKMCWQELKTKCTAVAGTKNCPVFPEPSNAPALAQDKTEQPGADNGVIEGLLVPIEEGHISSRTSWSAHRNRMRRIAPLIRTQRSLSKKLLKAKLEFNDLLRELIKELRRSNELREEYLNFLRVGSEEESSP